jgi:hypothetical protein
VALTVPPEVNLRKVDLGQELQILAYHEQQLMADQRVIASPTAGAGKATAS